MMKGDLVYVVHPDVSVAEELRAGLRAADYDVAVMSSVEDAESVISSHQFTLPDAILAPLGSAGDDSILVALFESNPLMEQIPLVVVAAEEKEDRRRALRMGLLSVVFPPYDDEEVVLTTKLAIDKHRSDQLLFGSLEQFSVPDLLQTAEVGRRTCTLTFQRNGSKGTVWMRDGFVVNAELDGAIRGEDAVYEIALWSTGTFEANFRAIDVDERFETPPSTLLLEAMRRFDEESASTMPIPVMIKDTDGAVLDLTLVVLNVVGSYALNHLHPDLIRARFDEVRNELQNEHPVLGIFNLTDEGAVTAAAVDLVDFDEDQLVRGVSLWVERIFGRLDEALAWRFSPIRFARLVAPWQKKLRRHGFSKFLDLSVVDEAGDVEGQDTENVVETPVPVGCLELDDDGVIQTVSIYGPRVGQVSPGLITGKSLGEILPSDLALLADRLAERLDVSSHELENVAIGREILGCGHQEFLLRMAMVKQATGNGSIVTINRLRDQRRSLSPNIERDPLTGSLRDGRTERLLVANEDFLQAFEGLFARSLMHRHHELLQRFGKKWGLRHAMRLEQVVQREYGKTLRELESQMALELLSSSVGIFGLGNFEADLGYRDSGLVVIQHLASPFPGIFTGAAGRACPILSGFHAAILSYLAGRQLAAREVHCSREPGDACLFVVATEERLTKLLIATPGSPDHDLLTTIAGAEKIGDAKDGS